MNAFHRIMLQEYTDDLRPLLASIIKTSRGLWKLRNSTNRKLIGVCKESLLFNALSAARVIRQWLVLGITLNEILPPNDWPALYGVLLSAVGLSFVSDHGQASQQSVDLFFRAALDVGSSSLRPDFVDFWDV